MKSHPDVASRVAAEVVTQLPVPSRLGMMRFERMNEANWLLLFLDASCDKQLGIAASDLCTLVETPYASLMEPEARYRLHDAIQLQLSEGAHYLVHYTLHTPRGPLRMMELGEPFRQRGRHLLRGYLMITDDAVTDGPRLPTPAPPTPKATTVLDSLEQFERSQAELQQDCSRSLAQQQLIMRLASKRYQSDDQAREAAELITRSACEIYAVARAGIWHLNGDTLDPVALYLLDQDQYEVAPAIDGRRYPSYLRALKESRSLSVQDAENDPRTRELRDDYLRPEAITALLDASIRVGGELVAVLCLEHTGGSRTWQAEEIAFVGELADQYANVLSNQARRSATSALYLFQRAVEQSASAFILLNRDGMVEYVNPSFTAITQYSADEVQGRQLAELPALENLSDLLFDSTSGLAEQNSWQGEFRSRRKNLEPYWGQFSISKVHADDGSLTHYIGIYEDITETKHSQQRIERLAYSDNLTGLGNRYAFIRALEKRFASNGSAPVSLLLVDIDNFKRINDTLGHQTGDKLLVSLAKRLHNSFSGEGTLARFASNEFAILLDNCQSERGQLIAQQVLQTMDKPLFVDNQLINVTGSVGLACSPEHGEDPQTLMKHAGLALHKAKANGKHQLQVFTDALNAEANYKLFVENNLRRALTQNELEVFYQPKLCLKNGQLLGVEALLRWQHPEKGMIRPDQFISVAEETGLIIPIGKWVVRQACRMSKQLTAVGLGNLQVAINLSPKQFSDPDLVGSIAAILEEEQLPPEMLELELTEGLLLEATEDTRSLLGRLKQLGLTLAMDDFGTGYSSLSYLKKFPIDVIKIDRSFIKEIPENQDDMEITSAVIAMAHNLKLTVVAEGIETAAQLNFLRRQHCDIGQGYLFDRPIAGRDLVESLKRYPRRPTR
ncbi:PAS domain S-box-containing protein/diguanylate cyclase (GGDEF) domain-containing protein [Pseudomonas flavescens]|uniref:cyclic-guanylate-specific phosphodiesterase n=1 Tax=Phytopseudomonas flavescens TaxID=29435 RepID=A0A1G8PG62_9GAMM|nr:EAL domain-containing protein [Pseudomonas flavescens]SDI90780.1 PAS domain S-box-containing protein/diguanylate cyclase (GGDEF) domain-containing protein [Pseudomonas flavescens]